MKKLLSLIIVLGAVFAPLSAQADPLTGYYKIAVVTDEVDTSSGVVVEKETEGASGRGKVFLRAGKLRFSGWIEEWDDDDAGEYVRERTSLRGVVNPDTGKIRLTKIGGVSVSVLAVEEEFVLKLKIIRRNDVVVGLTGNGSAFETSGTETEDETYNITGYKTRKLP